jgi:hypothetical protein
VASDARTRGPIRENPLWQAYDRLRYAILFYTLLLTLVMMPLATTLGLPAVLIKLLVGACLLTAVMPNATRRTRQILFAAVLLLILAQFVPERASPFQILYLDGLAALIGLLAVAGTLRFTVSTRTVSPETVYAALGTYLLAGIFFGQIYWLIESGQPGSFTGPDPFSEVNAVYYSFVTLATLGYGDFLPRTALTRGIATFEVIGGQLFLAVLVARLIGAFTPKEP